MGIGAKDHPAAACHRFAHILVNDRDMRGNIDSAVLLCGTQTKHVIILIDGAAHSAQRVVAVGQDIGERELLHARCARRLNDADEGDIMGCHGIKADPQIVHIIRCIM